MFSVIFLFLTQNGKQSLSWASMTVILLVLHRWHVKKEMMEVDVIQEGQYYSGDVD